MMLQRDPKVLTDDREPCRPQFPHFACHTDRAAKPVTGWRYACTPAARVQNLRVKRCIMRDQEIRLVQQAPQFGPKFAKGWAVTDMVPGQAMNMREGELLSRWPDEPMETLHDAIVLDVHDTDRASAVGAAVCRFKVNCREIGHPPRAVAPAQRAVTIGWSDANCAVPKVLHTGVAPGSS